MTSEPQDVLIAVPWVTSDHFPPGNPHVARNSPPMCRINRLWVTHVDANPAVCGPRPIYREAFRDDQAQQIGIDTFTVGTQSRGARFSVADRGASSKLAG